MVVAAVAIVVVGPKDLPVLLRTVGRYFGMVKRQADEFRNQFDEALRDSEFSELKKEFEEAGREAENSIRDLQSGLHEDMRDVERGLDETAPDAAASVAANDEPDADPSELAEMAADDLEAEELDPGMSEDSILEPETPTPANGHDTQAEPAGDVARHPETTAKPGTQ